ncbi:acyltransferase family protein [[Enterobacter] lignolyticus]|uniref:acyltransferase family protein n=1 Tax=[Enterobacter] lignolyticus TaxID=1334193 RepID=UPI0009006551|nr:acyltransferase [[Enterobacter] lignolyticus]
MKNRNEIIDIGRAMAVMLVTAFHIFVWSKSTGYDLPLGFNTMGIAGNGWVGVGMFFVLSGYCMAGSAKRIFPDGHANINSYLIYMFNRYLRISGPYYVSIIFWVVAINIFGVAVKPTGAIDVLSHLFYIHNLNENTFFSISGVYWSLAVEMQFYILLPFLIIFFKSNARRLALLLILFFLSILLNCYSENKLLTWGIPSYLYLFVLGWLCATYQERISRIVSKDSVFYLTILIFVFSLLYKGGSFNNQVKTYEIIVSTVFSLLLVSSISKFSTLKDNFIVKSAAFIGRASFTIYLYNYVFWVFDRDGVSNVSKLLIFCFVILFGCLMYFIIEKNTEKFRKTIMRKVNQNSYVSSVENA